MAKVKRGYTQYAEIYERARGRSRGLILKVRNLTEAKRLYNAARMSAGDLVCMTSGTTVVLYKESARG
jgi:hypothetical protein